MFITITTIVQNQSYLSPATGWWTAATSDGWQVWRGADRLLAMVGTMGTYSPWDKYRYTNITHHRAPDSIGNLPFNRGGFLDSRVIRPALTLALCVSGVYLLMARWRV